MIEQKFLPIGSVCILKEATRRVMITGFLAKGESSDKVYDYVGCMYPEGVLSSTQNLLFDHSQIDKIFALGYSDEEEKRFKEKLIEYLKKEGNVADSNNVTAPVAQEQVAPVVETPVQPTVQPPIQSQVEVLNSQPQAPLTVETPIPSSVATPVQPTVENQSETVPVSNSNVSPFNILNESEVIETIE